MTANDLFKQIMKDPILIERYDLSKELIEKVQLHSNADAVIIKIIKLIVQGVEDGTPDRSIYSQIKNHFNL